MSTRREKGPDQSLEGQLVRSYIGEVSATLERNGVSERERGRSKTRSKKTKYDASVSSRRDVVHIPSSTCLLEFTFEGYISSEVT